MKMNKKYTNPDISKAVLTSCVRCLLSKFTKQFILNEWLLRTDLYSHKSQMTTLNRWLTKSETKNQNFEPWLLQFAISQAGWKRPLDVNEPDELTIFGKLCKMYDVVNTIPDLQIASSIVGLKSADNFLALRNHPRSFTPRQVSMINRWYDGIVLTG